MPAQKDQISLTHEEDALIQEVKIQLHTTLSFRVISTATDTLIAGLNAPMKYIEPFSECLLEDLHRIGYTLVNPNHFGTLVLKDLLGMDIPYFTNQNKTVYYGTPAQGEIIGLAQNEHKNSVDSNVDDQKVEQSEIIIQKHEEKS